MSLKTNIKSNRKALVTHLVEADSKLTNMAKDYNRVAKKSEDEVCTAYCSGVSKMLNGWRGPINEMLRDILGHTSGHPIELDRQGEIRIDTLPVPKSP